MEFVFFNLTHFGRHNVWRFSSRRLAMKAKSLSCAAFPVRVQLRAALVALLGGRRDDETNEFYCMKPAGRAKFRCNV
jgi:hypothetical protein